MKNRKVRAQQIIMTVGCMGFLVWVGIRGMNERQGKDKSVDTVEMESLSLASEGLRIEQTTDEIVTVEQTYPTQMRAAAFLTLYTDQAGEIMHLSVDVNSSVEVGQEIAILRTTQRDTLGLGKATKRVKEAKQHVKEQLDLLLTIDRGEEGVDAKEKYDRQYDLYNEAKKTLTNYEEQVNNINTSQVKTVERPILAKQKGIVKQILVGAGRAVEANQPLLSMQGSQAQTLQIQVSSENYLFIRNYLPQAKGDLIFKDESRYALPASVLATLSQKSISEEGQIIMTLNAASISNKQDIRKLALSIFQVPTRVFDEKAIFMRDNTAYIWTLNAEDEAEAIPVSIVKREKGKAYVQLGTSSWNRVLVGDLTTVKEGEKLNQLEEKKH